MAKEKVFPEYFGLTAEVDAALVVVRNGLARGDYVHVINPHIPRRDGSKPAFNMDNIYATDYACGTVGCIGGYVAFVLGVSPTLHVKSATRGLRKLYYPLIDRLGEYTSYSLITPAAAVLAIDTFRKMGDPQWGAAIATAEREATQ